MSIFGVGVDLVELEKARRRLKDKPFIEKNFTGSEISYFRSKKDPAAHLATTFAAKEAVFKAFGTGWGSGKEIEIARDRSGKPYAALFGQMKRMAKGKEVMLSMTYTDNYAAAFAIIKKRKK